MLPNDNERGLYDNLWLASVRAATWSRVGRHWGGMLLLSSAATAATATGSGVAAALQSLHFWEGATVVAAVLAWLTTILSGVERQKGAHEARAEYMHVRTRLEVLREAMRHEGTTKPNLGLALGEIIAALGALETRFPAGYLYERMEPAGTLDGNKYLEVRGYAKT